MDNRNRQTTDVLPKLKTRPDSSPAAKQEPRQETEAERLERVRRIRDRKEMQKKRAKRKKLIRTAVYILIGMLGILLILALVAIFRRVSDNRQVQVQEEARQEEIDHSSIYLSSDVLHLSFPVLTLDGAGSGLSVSEFRLILEDLYAQNYVLVDPHSLASLTDEGFRSTQIIVPDGKKPLILSQYGVSYTANDRAHATALTRDASGRISCTYYNEEGYLVTGAQDVVPVVEEFIGQHPDFSYKGARGILGITGEQGVLGYRIEKDADSVGKVEIALKEEPEDNIVYDEYGNPVTDEFGNPITEEVYADEDDSVDENGKTLTSDDAGENGMPMAEAYSKEDDSDKKKAEEAEAKAKAEEEAEKALLEQNKKTVEELCTTLRSGGWYLASNSYGAVSYGSSADIVKEDAEAWNTIVGPLTGSVDMLLLPEAADIGKWSGYTDNDARYALLKEMGFRYFFVTDEETLTWVQIKPGYVRQGLHKLAAYAQYVSLMNGGRSDAAETQAVPEDTDTAGTDMVGPQELVGALQAQETGADEGVEQSKESAAEETYEEETEAADVAVTE